MTMHTGRTINSNRVDFPSPAVIVVDMLTERVVMVWEYLITFNRVVAGEIVGGQSLRIITRAEAFDRAVPRVYSHNIWKLSKASLCLSL